MTSHADRGASPLRRGMETPTLQDGRRPRRSSRPPPSRPTRTLRCAVFSDAIPGRNGVGTYYDDLVGHLQPLVSAVALVTPIGRVGNRECLSLAMPGDATQRIYLPAARAVWREMVELSPEVVISATPGPFGALGMALAIRLRAGFCVGFHTQLDQLAGLYWGRLRGPALRMGMRLWDRVMFRRADEVVVHNKRLLRAVRERGAASARVMGTPTARAFIARTLTPMKSTVANVSFIGRLAPEKELDQIWEAARAFPEIRFRFAGDGPLRERVDGWARTEPNVESLGWLRRDDVLALLDSSEVLVLPSRYETFGTIALEAMARGRLAIVSPHCGISQWPELAAGLMTMHGGERVAETLGRVCNMPPDARRDRAHIGRAATEQLTSSTVWEWVDVIEGMARSDPNQ